MAASILPGNVLMPGTIWSFVIFTRSQGSGVMPLSRVSRVGDGRALEAGIHGGFVGEKEGHLVVRTGDGACWVVGRALASVDVVAG